MTSSTTRPERVGSDRPSAETTPAVTVPANPSGLPSATTSCPTRSRDASPRVTGFGAPPRVSRTARSDSESRPTTSEVASVPSVKVAWTVSTPSTTCALVSRYPSGVSTLALPAPEPRAVRTSRLATLGRTVSATRTTAAEHASSSPVSSGSTSGSAASSTMTGQQRRCAGHALDAPSAKHCCQLELATSRRLERSTRPLRRRPHRPVRGITGYVSSGCVAEFADDVLVEAEVFFGCLDGELAVESFADAEVELARIGP